MTNWKEVESDLKKYVYRVNNSHIFEQKKGAIEIKYYHCKPIMDLVEYIRINTEAKDIGATHHIFKILFKQIIYPNKGYLEYKTGIYKIDIYLDGIKQNIEVKTITQMEIDELYKKAIGVIESPLDDSDFLWIFYFYKINWLKDSNQSCHYLLVYVNINILEQESSTLRRDLIHMVEESKVAVSKKLNIRPTLIIPLENLIKVEDLERIVEEKDQQLEEKDQQLEEKDQQFKRIIEKKDQQLEEKEKIIQELIKKNSIEN